MIRVITVLLFFTFHCGSNGSPLLWINQIPKPWEIDENDFDEYLEEFQIRFPDFHQRVKAINLWRVGTPYGIYCLGEEIGIDDDPILRADTSDCTVHVLTTLAFASSSTWSEARNKMIQIHYKPDSLHNHLPSFQSRWHFTSDRILNHNQTVDITSTLFEPRITEQVSIELNIKDNGDEFLDLDWSSLQTITYIPSELISSIVTQKLPQVCGVAFVKVDYFKLGIVIAHEGYLIDQTNLIHASSEHGMTVQIDFMDYLVQGNSYRFDGVMFFKLNQAS